MAARDVGAGGGSPRRKAPADPARDAPLVLSILAGAGAVPSPPGGPDVAAAGGDTITYPPDLLRGMSACPRTVGSQTVRSRRGRQHRRHLDQSRHYLTWQIHRCQGHAVALPRGAAARRWLSAPGTQMLRGAPGHPDLHLPRSGLIDSRAVLADPAFVARRRLDRGHGHDPARCETPHRRVRADGHAWHISAPVGAAHHRSVITRSSTAGTSTSSPRPSSPPPTSGRPPSASPPSSGAGDAGRARVRGTAPARHLLVFYLLMQRYSSAG